MGDAPSLADLRALLHDGDDDQLAAFLESYSLAEGAARLIKQMSPGVRRAFFSSLVGEFPEDFGFQNRGGGPS